MKFSEAMVAVDSNMASVVLEGATLGQRQRYYNLLLNEATANGKAEPAKIDYKRSDIQNLFNIDIACKNRDVEYILDVFKCQDMLYVSRAVKRSDWLVTDEQYAHLINPEFLHSTLFPLMLPKAITKLLLHIRKVLKDESRVHMFFKYFKEKSLKTALKWLPNCSIGVIEDIVEKHASQISVDIFKHLCKRSPKVLELFINATQSDESINHYDYLKAAMFLLHTHPTEYLDSFDKTTMFESENYFNKKYSELIMKKCPQRIVDNFQKYRYCIDIRAFAKRLNTDIKSFILKQLENEEVKHFDQYIIGNLIIYMPKEEKYEFVKQFIDKKIKTKGDEKYYKMYRWYAHMPFNVAFPELKKMIQNKKEQDKTVVLWTLISNAAKDMQNVHTLLQYFQETYMNESYHFKASFVRNLLRETDANLYHRNTWAILDTILRSMNVYTKNKYSDQVFVKAIIRYKVTHNETVPAMLGQKLQFEYMNLDEWRLKGADSEKLFSYLFNLYLSKLNNRNISSQKKLDNYVDFLNNGLALLKYWKKNLNDYPILITKMKQVVKTKNEKRWKSQSFMALYDVAKSWRKAIIEDSLVLFPSQKVCLNALKYDPELLVRYRKEVEELCCNDAVRLDKLLHKIRIYWPETLATEWIALYRALLAKPNGHKSLARGICCLLNQDQLLEFLREHKPLRTNPATKKRQLSLWKHIAQNVHVARPQVTPDIILWYAENDYAQYTQLSLNTVMLKLRAIDNQSCIDNLLDSDVSLQKQGIHLAFAKLSSAEMKIILKDCWKTAKVPAMRRVILYNTHKLLCTELDESLIAEIWELMKDFIDSLTAEEDKALYYTFRKMKKVHPSIKPAYYEKSYRLLNSIPLKSAWTKTLTQLKREMSEFTELLDSDFVSSIIEEFVDNIVLKHTIDHENYDDMRILGDHLLSASDGKVQTERFKKVFVPLLDKLLPLWEDSDDINDIGYFDDMNHFGGIDDSDDDDYEDIEDMYDIDDMYDSDDSDDENSLVQKNFDKIIQHLLCFTRGWLTNNKTKPSPIYRYILNKLSKKLPVMQNIVLFRQLKLAAAVIDIFEKTKSNLKDGSENCKWTRIVNIYNASVPDIGKLVIKYVKEDIGEYGPLFYKPVAEAFNYVFEHIGLNNSIKMKCLRYMLCEKDFIPICLLAIDVLPTYWVDEIKEGRPKRAMLGDQQNIIKEIHKILINHPAPVVQLNYMMKIAADD